VRTEEEGERPPDGDLLAPAEDHLEDLGQPSALVRVERRVLHVLAELAERAAP
jgi:hypothetical protein